MQRYLQQLALFRAIPPRERDALAQAAVVSRFRKGDTIFEEGQSAECVWIIRQGCVYLVKRTVHGGRVTIFVMTPSEAICGVSAFEHGTYSAGAMAATDAQLIKIPAARFASLLDRYPAFGKHVLLTCCHRIRHMADSISLAQAPVEQRIAHVLLRLSATLGKEIAITHHELARMVGARWETSIRVLSSMKRHGLVTSSRGKITVLASHKLRALLRHNGFDARAS